MEISDEDRDYILGSFRESLSILVKDEKALSINIEEIRLDTSGTDPMIVVLFRNLEYPECIFGRSMDAVEPVPVNEEPMDREIWNSVLWANFMEVMFSERVRQRQDCSNGVIWVF